MSNTKNKKRLRILKSRRSRSCCGTLAKAPSPLGFFVSPPPNLLFGEGIKNRESITILKTGKFLSRPNYVPHSSWKYLTTFDYEEL
jgi:hypothetical protein